METYRRELTIFCECTKPSTSYCKPLYDRCICSLLWKALKTCIKVIKYWIRSFNSDPRKIEKYQNELDIYTRELINNIELILSKKSKSDIDRLLENNYKKICVLLENTENCSYEQKKQLKLLRSGYEKALNLLKMDSAQEMKNPEILPVNPSFRPPVLKNIGNSCYMDASLQFFWLLKEDLSKKIEVVQNKPFNKRNESLEDYLKQKKLCSALSQFYMACSTAKSELIQESLYHLRQLIFLGSIHPEFKPGHESRQMDSEPFISLLLEALNEKLPYYQILTADNLREPKIDNEGKKRFIKINLGNHINKDLDIQHLIDSNHVPEPMPDWKIHPRGIIDHSEPAINGQKQDMLLLFDNEPPPSYIFLQLLREDCDAKGFSKKIGAKIRFPENNKIHLPFSRAISHQEDLTNEQVEYQIVGVQNHHGYSLHGGHYTADIQDPQTGKWFHCNDIGGNAEAKPDFKINEQDCYFLLIKKC